MCQQNFAICKKFRESGHEWIAHQRAQVQPEARTHAEVIARHHASPQLARAGAPGRLNRALAAKDARQSIATAPLPRSTPRYVHISLLVAQLAVANPATPLADAVAPHRTGSARKPNPLGCSAAHHPTSNLPPRVDQWPGRYRPEVPRSSFTARRGGPRHGQWPCAAVTGARRSTAELAGTEMEGPDTTDARTSMY